MATPLVRPANPQVQVNPTPSETFSEGLNYPTFRLLNKKSRVTLSPDYLSADPAFNYQDFSVANRKGWFAAIQNAGGSFGVLLSPLNQLRTAIKECSGEHTSFQPQRFLSFSNSEPNIVAFAHSDTRLIVGFKSGQLVSYDTASLFTAGTDEIQPLQFLQDSNSPPTQIQPNHSTDPALSDLVAVVRKDGNVELLNTALEKQHVWGPGDANSTPVAVSWSVKGKQLAIGLALGDIMTFTLANKNAPQRHIPPTADGILVSLNWLAPGHTFRTSYSPPTPGSDDPVHHIVHQDAKTSPVQYTRLDHSFQAPDRTKQTSYVVVLPKWDEDQTNSNADESKLLVVVGDVSCTDLEILGNQGLQWYQQSQDNPLAIPLDKNSEDTVLLSLDVDLTDVESGSPVVYAYLNDGTVQAWHVDGGTPYAGLITGDSSVASSTTSSFGTPAQPATSVFGASSNPPASSAFGQPSSFGSSSSFGSGTSETSPFNQPSSSPSPFGQQTSAFGSNPSTSSSFGSPSSSAFGGGSQTTSAFGGGQTTQSAFGGQPQTTSAFGGGGGSTFGQSSFGQPSFGQSSFGQQPSTSAFGSTASSSSGGAFGSFVNTITPSPFGGSFGSPAPSATSPPITRDDSMGDSTPSFGGLSLGGSDEKKPSAFGAGGGMFGSAANQESSTSTTSAFGGSSTGGGVVKPASGFGAFGGASSGAFGVPSTTPPAFGGGAFSAKPDQPAASAFSGGAFSAKPATESAFGKSTFGQSSFGQSGFGQPSAFGKPVTPASTTSSSTGGGFAVFASGGASTFGSSGASGGTSSLGGSSTPASSTTSNSGGGFAAFASTGASSFGSAGASETTSAFGSKKNDTGSAFGQPSAFGTPSAFGKSSETSSVFGSKSESKPSSGFAAFSNQPSAFGTAAASSSSAFGNTSTTPSAFGGSPSAFSSNTPDTTPSKKPPGTADPLSPSPSPPASPSPASPSPALPIIPSTSSSSGFSAFRPSEGFGAFGATVSSDSPFLKKTDTQPVVTAFGSTSSATPTTPSSSSASPAFGSTSKLGFGFGVKPGATPTTPSPLASAVPASGGFSAFSSGTSTFGAFANSNKVSSFGALLKGGEDEKKEKAPVSVFGQPSEKKAPVSVFGQPSESASMSQKGKEKEPSPPVDRSATPMTESNPATPRPLTKSLKEEERTPKPDGSKSLTPSTFAKTDEPPTPPADNESSSQSSSYVDVRRSEAGDSDHESDAEAPPEDEDEGFLTESYGSESEGEEGEEPEEQHNPPVPPSRIPLPRSHSSTPQAETPRVSPSAPEPEAYDDDYEDEPTVSEEEEEEEGETDDDATSDSSRLSTIGEESETNTPPGSPSKKESQPATPAADSTSSQTSSSNLLGIGRPTTRPSRSSPLAVSAPLSAYEEEFEATTPTANSLPALPIINKLRPASPKLPFGVLPQQSSSSQDDSKAAKRPKTPPLLSNFGLGGPSASSKPSLFGQPTTSLFGAKPLEALAAPSPSTSTPAAPAATRSVFSVPGPSTSNISAPGQPSSSAFGAPAAMKPSPFGLQFPSPSLPIKKEEMPSPSGSLFSTPPVMPPKMSMPLPPQPSPYTPLAIAPSARLTPPTVSPTQQVQPGQPTGPPPMKFQEGMQQECAILFATMAKELEELRRMAAKAAEKREALSKSQGGSKRKEDLVDPKKWSLSDAPQMTTVLRQHVQDINELKEHVQKQKTVLADLNSGMIKIKSRKEEIARFNKAKKDNEFSKMLKLRTLGPEHLETQTQLRRNIRNLGGRVDQLEEQLKSHKKKIAEYKSGKPSLRAPTIDTINRTYRNIDIAIQQQTDDIASLTSRVKKLNLSSPSTPRQKPGLGERDPRLPDPARRPFTVTPNVAVTTAAALNAERYAHKLKKALLAARKEPLLNTTAAAKASDVPVAFSTPGKKPMGSGLQFNTPMPGPLFGTESLDASAFDHFPEDKFNPSTPVANSRRGGASRRNHASAVQLRKSPGASTALPEGAGLGSPPVGFGTPSPMPGLPEPAVSSSPAPSFDWGPLPTFNKTSAPSMFASISLGNKSSGKP